MAKMEEERNQNVAALQPCQIADRCHVVKIVKNVDVKIKIVVNEIKE